jgi:RNA polymerase sigma-70 factor, ECF subfamily
LLDPHDQLAVIRGLQHGYREAWTKLYDGYRLEVWRYAARLVGPDAAAVADVVQETFLEAARSVRHFDADRGTLWAWLSGIAHHRVASHWRQVSRNDRVRKLAAAGAAEICHLLDEAKPSEQWGEQHERAELVRCVLAELPADYAALLTAKYLDECSLADLSQQGSSSVEAVKSKLARARREFRVAFERLTREVTPTTEK